MQWYKYNKNYGIRSLNCEIVGCNMYGLLFCFYLKVFMQFAESSPSPMFMQSTNENLNKIQAKSIPHPRTPNMMCSS
jgi:hypothetical protein